MTGYTQQLVKNKSYRVATVKRAAAGLVRPSGRPIQQGGACTPRSACVVTSAKRIPAGGEGRGVGPQPTASTNRACSPVLPKGMQNACGLKGKGKKSVSLQVCVSSVRCKKSTVSRKKVGRLCKTGCVCDTEVCRLFRSFSCAVFDVCPQRSHILHRYVPFVPHRSTLGGYGARF